MTGEVDPPVGVCPAFKPHKRHRWLAELGSGRGVGLGVRSCPGRPARVASFDDYRWVLNARCFGTDGGTQCRRLLVFERVDGDAVGQAWAGWRMSEPEPGAGGPGYASRVWLCPDHLVEPLSAG